MTYYLEQVRAYWRDARTLRDFIRLMRVRLSLSKVGWLVCPHPIVVRVAMRSFGGSIWVRSHTSDISVLNEQLLGDAYGGITRHAREPETIVDLGANTGLVARWLMHRYPGARLICVEPEQANVELLLKNVRHAAKVVPACIGGHERTVSLSTSDGAWAFTIADGEGETPVITMDRLIDEHGLERIDVLKCDIEGAEAELFDDAPWIDRVGMAVVECHGFPGERIMPEGWRIVERDENSARPQFEVVTLLPAATA
jgi:FkbM family methyltransferase